MDGYNFIINHNVRNCVREKNPKGGKTGMIYNIIISEDHFKKRNQTCFFKILKPDDFYQFKAYQVWLRNNL